ncbi:MAG: hypothetical protein RR945_00005 [Erysipelotrichaceae bacterium]
MKRLLTVFITTLLCFSSFCLPTMANSSESNSNFIDTNEIYVDDNYNQYSSGEVQPRNRGNCTDVYTREWCNAHGFENNRPVPGSVQLNAKEKRCYFEMLGNAAWNVLTSSITMNAAKLYYGTASVVFKFYKCLL